MPKLASRWLLLSTTCGNYASVADAGLPTLAR